MVGGDGFWGSWERVVWAGEPVWLSPETIEFNIKSQNLLHDREFGFEKYERMPYLSEDI